MNRLFICIILLSFGTAASAETLYRWIEADGSITFSPKKPPAGVDYKTIQSPGASKSSIKAADKSTRLAPATQATSTSISSGELIRPADDSQRNNQQVSNNRVQPNATVKSNKKKGQCVELSKRVVSLERRLRSKLKAADMDNTVVAMARYQRSYDQYCVE